MQSKQTTRPSLDALLVEVLGKPEQDRPSFLDLLCRDDTDLRRELEEMTQAYEEAGGFLETPAVAVNGTLCNTLAEGPGTVIDKYKLLQLIGEGGFGAVYMAEQKEPVKRRVALKIIKLGMDTRQVIARFEAERQALALMEHPNIARVLDAGATSGGRPYFVMELVKGLPITEYCDQNNLSTRARLDLFRDVCHAVQHAHQKGVVHRDIKPSNVLVTLHDGSPVPKVIDFGIAKAMNQELTEKTIFTEFRQFIGTPEYMSPEQAEMSGLDIDTRSDIYSLGVLLYELLTGTTPFDSETLRKAGYAEIQRVIRDEEPPKPSQRVSTLGEQLTSVAKHRQIDPSDLTRIMRGDLDWIVMKTLEKNRTRRYETANGLAADIERHLADEPVLASPPSTTYKMRKFVRRNRGAVVAGSIITAALLIGVTLAIVGFARANYQKQLADLEAIKAAAVSGFLQDMLASVDPDEANGRAVSVQYVLDQASAEIDAGALSDQPNVEIAIRMTLGQTYHALGLFRPAEHHWDRALELSKRVHGDESAEVADCLHGFGLAVLRSFEPLRADPYLRQALSLRRKVHGAESLEVAEALISFSIVLECNGRLDEAKIPCREALTIRRSLLGDNHAKVAESLRELAANARARGDLDEADRMSREARGIEQKLGHDNSTMIARQLKEEAQAHWRLGDHAKAEELYLDVIEMYRGQFGEKHPNVAQALARLGWFYYELGNHEASLAAYRAATDTMREVYGESNVLVMEQMGKQTMLLQAMGDHQQADAMLRDTLKMAQEVLTGDHPTAEYLRYLTDLLKDRERASMAEPVYRQALAIDRRVLGHDHPLLAVTLTNLAIVHEHQDEFDAARPLLEEALALRQRVLGDQHPETLDSAERLARLGGE